MKPQHIAGHQRIKDVKKELAREMRKNMTQAETLLWEHLRGNQLAGLHFRRQQIIFGFIADFYCHACGLVIELDGGVHDEQELYDECRDKLMKQSGIKVLRFRNEQIADDLVSVIEQIIEACTNHSKSE